MIAYPRKQLIHLLKVDFVRFCIVGGTGFVINFVILNTLHELLGMPVFIAQLAGAEIALFSNFILHHNWTYKNNRVKKTLGKLLTQFHATTWPAIIGSAFMVDIGIRFLKFSSLVALMVSSAIALLWNFVWSKYVIWRSVTDKEIEEIAR